MEKKWITVETVQFQYFPTNALMQLLKKKVDRNENFYPSKDFMELVHFFPKNEL